MTKQKIILLAQIKQSSYYCLLMKVLILSEIHTKSVLLIKKMKNETSSHNIHI